MKTGIKCPSEYFPLESGLWTGTYQTVPVSRAEDTDRALSILVVKTADTRPYCELFALSMAFCWLLKLNIHCTGPKIWEGKDSSKDQSHVQRRESHLAMKFNEARQCIWSRETNIDDYGSFKCDNINYLSLVAQRLFFKQWALRQHVIFTPV